MAIKAGDLIQIAYKRRNTTGFTNVVEYLVLQVMPGKPFVIATNGNYTTTLDLASIRDKARTGKAKIRITSKNDKGGYDWMARMTDENKMSFIQHFHEKGISDDSMREAVRTFQLSLPRVKAYLESLGIYEVLGMQSPAKKHGKQAEALAEEAVKENEAEANNPIGPRIKYLRNLLDLTMEQFGKRIKVSRSHICNIEASKDLPSDALFHLISLEFGIDEEWLRTGHGQMPEMPAEDVSTIPAMMLEVKKRLVATHLRGSLADYSICAGKVLIMNRQNNNLFLDIQPDDIPDLIMELDELLTILDKNNGVAAATGGHHEQTRAAMV
jgi:transcriptional regulator with XRE-family HTH domain